MHGEGSARILLARDRRSSNSYCSLTEARLIGLVAPFFSFPRRARKVFLRGTIGTEQEQMMIGPRSSPHREEILSARGARERVLRYNVKYHASPFASTSLSACFRGRYPSVGRGRVDLVVDDVTMTRNAGFLVEIMHHARIFSTR